MQRTAWAKRRAPIRGLWAIVGVFTVIVLLWLPAIHTPLRFDDAFLFVRDQTSFWDYLWAVVRSRLDGGRFQPMSITTAMVPWVFADARTPYKLYLLGMSVLALALTWRLLRRLGASPEFASAAVLLAAALYQFRWYHDTLLGYSGLLQWTAVLLCVSALAWLRYVESGSIRWLAGALTAWLACVTLYEANFSLVGVLLVIVAFRRGSRRQVFIGAVVFLAPAIAVAAGSVAMRASFGLEATEPGYATSLHLGNIVTAFVHTLEGAIPASYLLWDPSGIMGEFSRVELAAGAWRGFVVALLVAVMVYRAAGAQQAALGWLAIVGAALWTMPSALLVLTPKYRNELVPGQAYLPVFLQVLGIGLLLAAAAVAVVRRIRSHGAYPAMAATAAFALLTGVAAAATGTANLRVVAFEQPMGRTRDLLNRSLAAGVLLGAPRGASIIGQARDLHWYPYTYETYKNAFDALAVRTAGAYDMRVDSNLPVPAAPCPADRQPALCAPLAAEGGWLAVRALPDGGVAVLSRPSRGAVGDPQAQARAFTAYVEGPRARTAPVLVGLLPDGRPWNSSGAVSWRRVRGSDDRVLFNGTLSAEVGPAVSTIDVPGAPVNLVSPGTPAQQAKGLGQWRLLP